MFLEHAEYWPRVSDYILSSSSSFLQTLNQQYECTLISDIPVLWWIHLNVNDMMNLDDSLLECWIKNLNTQKTFISKVMLILHYLEKEKTLVKGMPKILTKLMHYNGKTTPAKCCK